MSPLERARRIRTTVGIAAATVLVDVIYPMLRENAVPTGITLLLMLVSLLTLASIVEVLADELFERSLSVRRVVAGRDYIEGEWLDCTDSNKDQWGLVSIRYRDG